MAGAKRISAEILTREIPICADVPLPETLPNGLVPGESGALGICVRSIAPFLRHKFTDPSVLCVDEMSNFVVPVVGGHARLSNETARGLASRLGAVPVVTTASDVSGAFAIDSWALGASFDLRSVLPRTPSWNPEGRANDFSVLSENELEALSLFVRPHYHKLSRQT